MAQKPKIQYIGQFYVHGSEARQLELEQERKNAKTKLPLARLQKMEKIYVDPVAMIGIAVAAFMLVTMVIGALQLRKDWTAYERMSGYVSELKQTNAELSEQYRQSYDLDDIKSKALALGMIPRNEVSTVTITVTMPEPEPEISRIDEIKASLEGLFA